MAYIIIYLIITFIWFGIISVGVCRGEWMEESVYLSFIWPIAGLVFFGFYLGEKSKEN